MTAPRLHTYQQRAVDHLHRNPKAGLFLDMGLGKTAIALRALTPAHLPVLVVAPVRVARYVWPAEAALWRPDLTLRVAYGGPAARAAALADRAADVVVLGRDSLADAVPYAGHWNTVILDELSSFKSRKSKRWAAARKCTAPAAYVWGLTGTPASNGLLDLWAQLYLLDSGTRLGRFISHYRNRYFTVGTRPDGRPAVMPYTGVVTKWDIRPGAEDDIHSQIEDICVSMKADDYLQLPQATYNYVQVPLPPKVLRQYRALKRYLAVSIPLLGDGAAVHTADNAAILTAKLSQIAAGFIYPDQMDYLHGAQPTPLHTAKVDAVKEIVDGTGSPVLLFYRFRYERAALLRALPQAEEIDDAPDVIARWNAGGVPVLLAHPASVGHGLNLQQGGHTIIWSSLTWSLEEWQQANSRLIRQGQRYPVMVHVLLAPHTVDEAVLQALTEKASVQEALLTHLESPL